MADKANDQWVQDGTRIKAWFVMLRDIMSSGKLAVQIGHGTDYIHMSAAENPHYANWMRADVGNRRKIVLGAKTKADLDKIAAECADAGMLCSLIVDAGLTEFNGVATVTGLVVHPHPDNAVPSSLKRAQAWKDIWLTKTVSVA